MRPETAEKRTRFPDRLATNPEVRRAASGSIFLAALLCLCAGGPALASDLEAVSLAQAQSVWGEVRRLGALREEPEVRELLDDRRLIGYMWLSDRVKPIPAYSGRPVRMLAAMDMSATIRGVRILAHEEPILVIGIDDDMLADFVDQFENRTAGTRLRIGAYDRPGYVGIDGITGATVTAMVLSDSIVQSAAIVAQSPHLPRAARDRPVPVAAETGGASTEAGGASMETGGAPTETGGASTEAGGASTEAGGASMEAGGAPTETGGVSTETGRASMETDGAAAEPLWKDIWRQRTLSVTVLGIALVLLTCILFFQDWLVIHPRLFHRLRIAYLVFTVVYLGFVCKAQLSVVNLLAFMRILFADFTWHTLLIDPVVFLLWSFVAVSIILWGRGVFCGWLCPFGALQELIHKLAERFELPSWDFPPMVHERLWAIKYFILIALVGLSMESMSVAARLAEVEPFKTVFVMRFDRELVFVGFALLLLVLSVFISKFYCKYLCPLGAGLSFFTRFRIFDWLRRRRECGRPCQSCATQCQISAIKPTGEIIDNECHYCLECQVTYWDDRRCPPLVEKRKRREERGRGREDILAREA